MKRTILKRKFAPLKKHSKSEWKRAQKEADDALQAYYRSLGFSCEACGRPANLMHHFVEKSQSARLRYEEQNLIPLCTGCHCKHHLAGDPAIVAAILKKRGRKWFCWILKEREKKVKYTLDELRGIASFYGHTE